MLDIIDSHIHFWDPARIRYDWLADVEKLNRPYLPDDLPREGDGWRMTGLVMVEADCNPADSVKEAVWVATLRDERIKGIVAQAALEKGDGVRPQLEKLKSVPLVKGVRRLIQAEALGFSLQPDFVAAVQSLPEYGFSFDICIYHPQLGDVIQLVRQCPDVSFVLDHIGKPGIKDGLLDPWRAQISALAELPNVQCKFSGMLTEADHQNWQVEDLRPYIDHVLEAFGPSRLMYGGDHPVLELAASYPRWMELALEYTDALSDDEKRLMFHDNARAFYRVG